MTTLYCDKCDHRASQLVHTMLDDGSLMRICNTCEVHLDECKWELPEDAASARKAGYHIFQEAKD